uniref:ShKT domain-containing protein n=1 Tax=Panagrolaimus sp. JU765 TaxID=591449 RepID=A0AC34QGW2_9BILA
MIFFIFILSVFGLVECQTVCLGPCISGICPTNYTCQASTGFCCSNDVATTTSAPCIDKMTNCAAYRHLCNNNVYYDLMTQQCAKTCCRCKSICVDRINPKTGYSDCPNVKRLCNDPNYYNLMTQECPRTCGRC